MTCSQDPMTDSGYPMTAQDRHIQFLKYSVPLRSVGQFEDDEEPNPNGQTKDAPKEEIKEFYFQGKWRPYKRSSA